MEERALNVKRNEKGESQYKIGTKKMEEKLFSFRELQWAAKAIGQRDGATPESMLMNKNVMNMGNILLNGYSCTASANPLFTL